MDAILSPFTQTPVRPGDRSAAVSVHLATWPVQDPAALDDDLRAQVATVRALVEAGRAARTASNVRVRQPLARGLVGLRDGQLPPPELLAYVREELNVRDLANLASAGEVLDVTVKPNFRQLGQRFGARTQVVAAAIARADPAALAQALRDGAATALKVGGETVEITADDVVVNQTPRSGWAVATQRDVTIALDTTITPELHRAGVAREVIRLIQDARKQAGLAITDRVALTWTADDDVASAETAAAIREHERDIADAVLATSMTEGDPGEPHSKDGGLGLRFSIRRAQ